MMGVFQSLRGLQLHQDLSFYQQVSNIFPHQYVPIQDFYGFLLFNGQSRFVQFDR